MGRVKTDSVSKKRGNNDTRLPTIKLPLVQNTHTKGLPIVLSVLPMSNKNNNNTAVNTKRATQGNPPSMLYEGFKGLKLTTRPASQGSKIRLAPSSSVDSSPTLQYSDVPTPRTDPTTGNCSINVDGGQNTVALSALERLALSFRFSFRTMGHGTAESSEKLNLSSPQRLRFTSLETAADKENQRLGLTPRSSKGSPLDSLVIGQKPDAMENNNNKNTKKRLLRKPLPLNHYKKSKKLNSLDNTDVEGFVSIGAVPAPNQNTLERTNSFDVNETEIIGNSHNSVSEWLDNIKQQDFDRISSNGEDDNLSAFEADDCRLERVGEGTGGDTCCENDELLSHGLESAQSLQLRQEIRAAHSGKLPVISAERMGCVRSQNRSSHRYSGAEFEPIASDDAESGGRGGSNSGSPDCAGVGGIHFPRLHGRRRTANSSSGSSSGRFRGTLQRQGAVEDGSEEGFDVLGRLPPLALSELSEGEELERQRLRLINLSTPVTARDLMCGQSLGAYIHKGASSQRYAPGRQPSLRQMAATFQRHMSTEVETKPPWSERLAGDTRVIDNNTYDYFARKNKPKPAMFTPGMDTAANGKSKVKVKELVFPKAANERGYNSVDATQELSGENYARLKHTLRRDHSNVSTHSSKRGDTRRGSREARVINSLQRSNSMSSIASKRSDSNRMGSRRRCRRDGSEDSRLSNERHPSRHRRRDHSRDESCDRRTRGRSLSRGRARSFRVDRD